MKCINTEDFIQKAKEIHGDKYDYSEFTYTKMKNKSTIICPLHGKFEQSPSQHLTRKCGCSKCKWLKRNQTCLEKYGVENPFASQEIITSEIKFKAKNNREQNNLIKYGVKNVSSLPWIRKKIIQTNLEHFGVPYYSQTQESKQHLRQLISSEECQEKTKQTNLIKYGVTCTYNLEKARQQLHKSLNSEEYKIKRKLISENVYLKGFETRRKNHSLNTSKFEKEFYKRLLDVYEENDIFCNYKSEQYPYHCDFYISSKKQYIELNIHWSHGQHIFNPNSQDDINKLQIWQEKANAGHKAYQGAIRVWTVTDITKIQTAQNNNLNYVTLWNQYDIDNFFNTLEDNYVGISI